MSEEPTQDQQPPAPDIMDESAEAVTPDQVIMAGESETEPMSEESVSLEEQIATAKAQADEYLDGWQRSRAELANYKKRVEREREQWIESMRGEIITSFLPVLDDFERALANLPDDLKGQEWVEGTSLIYRKLQGILEVQGITEIEAVGQPFDPALHEAIAQEPNDDHEAGCVVAVMQKGYKLNDRVIRPAIVRIAS